MATAKRGRVRIGTSGWMYKDWGARFYPADMRKGFLTYLAGEFDTVEVNSSFYHLPRTSTFAKWRAEVPREFRFAVKMSRYITHQRKLVQCRMALRRFFAAASGMQGKLSIILIQLPPSLPYDHTRLEKFLKDLRATQTRARIRARFALEPRHQSWVESAEDVRALLRRYRVALVFPHSAKIPSFAPEDDNVLTDTCYVRFHGPSEFAASRYGSRRLKSWAARIERWARRGLDVYVYFNNDQHGHAIDDARTLKRLLQQ